MKKLWAKVKPYILWVAGLFVALWALRRYLKPSFPRPSTATMREQIEAVNADETVQRKANAIERMERLARIELNHKLAADWIDTHTDPFHEVCRNQVDIDPEAKKILDDNKKDLYL